MLKNFIFFISLLFLKNLTLFAQSPNLVPNSSFETYDDCPTTYTPFQKNFHLITDWSYASYGTPDYFNRCCKNKKVGVPQNFAGKTQPKTGDAYMGIIVVGSFNKGNDQFREYIQTCLTNRLEHGEKYCVSFHYKLSKFSKFAVDQLGVFFTDKEVRKEVETYLSFHPQVNNPSGNFLDNQDKWQKFCGVFTAQGTENHLIIGNFKNTENTQMIESKNYTGKKNKRGKEYAYYYIDDVSVQKIVNCDDCSCIPKDLSVQIKNRSQTLFADVRGGTKPYNFLWSNNEKTQEIKNKNGGSFEVSVQDKYNCKTKDKIQLERTKALNVSHESSFNGGNTGKINLKITGGTPPYKVKWSNGKTSEKIKDLTAGEYTYKVSDIKNNKVEKTVKFLDEKADLTDKLESANEGENIRLKVFFDSNKFNLLDKSIEELEQLFAYMQKYDVQLVQISGHTDSQGSDTHNQKLSENRVKSVKEYLVNKGIPEDRLQYVGYGETKPVATNKTAEGRQLNRRVEFKILKK